MGWDQQESPRFAPARIGVPRLHDNEIFGRVLTGST
jgi:hypothetical protein